MAGVQTVSRRSFLGLCAGNAVGLLALRPSSISAATLPPRGESVRQKSADEILALRPFAYTSESPFLQPGVTYGLADGEEPSESQVVDLLAEFLEAEFPDDAATRAKARALFDDPLAREKIPSPSLRAAVVGLWRTSAGPGINHLMHSVRENGSPKVKSVVFDYDRARDRFRRLPKGIAEVYADRSSSVEDWQITIYFNPNWRASYPFHFVPTMAHECLHQDTTVTNLEEITCTLIDSIITLELASRHPDFFAERPSFPARTDLPGGKARIAMLRLNGGTGSRLGLFSTPTGGPIVPNDPTPVRSMWEGRENKDDLVETPGNPLLAQYLERFRYPENPPAPADKFSMDLVNWLDQNAASLGPEELLAAARALKLEIPE
jgi:hypothetical protein